MATPELEAIAELSEPLIFRRPTQAGKRVVGGKIQTPTADAVAFEGEVQPAAPRNLRHLPEGTDARDVAVIFTGTELLVDDEIEATTAGGVMSVGDVYVVQTFERWPEGEFFEVTALRRKGNLS